MKKLTDQQIIKSWKNNVKPWVQAIEQGEIKSRVEVTNQAIVDAVLASSPKSVLDVGCGEGWLTRELAKSGIDVLGVDVVPELVEAASSKGAGRFKTIAYEDLSPDVPGEKFDVVVCNFSLLGDESVNHLFSHVSDMLNENGVFIVQTIHPVSACGDFDYVDGWRAGSWAGFSEQLSRQFAEPAPWYFRTMQSWEALFVTHGLTLARQIEPLNSATEQPASVIFVGRS